MSGHSKWSTIKRQKGATDVKRGMTFTKLANTITIATRLGGSGSPEDNPRLRFAVDQARTVSMPKDNIQRAIDRGLGKLPGQTIDEVIYEGFGPGRAAFLVEGATDNRMRTTQEIKNLFDRSGGAMGAPGSTAYMFDRKGEIKVRGKGGEPDDEELELIDLGVEDLEAFEEDGVKKFLVYTEVNGLNNVSKQVTDAGFSVEFSGIIYQPNITVQISDPEVIKKAVDLAGRLEDHDDVQKIFTNFEIINYPD